MIKKTEFMFLTIYTSILFKKKGDLESFTSLLRHKFILEENKIQRMSPMISCAIAAQVINS